MPRPGRRTSQVLSTLVTLLLLAGLWWLQSQGDDEDGGTAREDSSAVATPTDGARSPTSSVDEHGLPYVDLADLPREAAETVDLIDAGGPFPYPRNDDQSFGNFEGLLPDRPRGYYREYTVETPGLSHRGARRIVAGDGGELYWTEDHYQSFERIRR
ncbi:ribonuclease T1 [Nocardioides sp. J9]|uniref:ribonuclease domain-containing protein n=1 Tax=Nocardioides sp. J9 TaxID=935844 RepID=UPI0011AD9FE6|nr:ribonuclease domain-containing protein [Nocardioides sp. J9]TWH01330.1 ribonuclease T1 [Nocardioides sp. J9]